MLRVVNLKKYELKPDEILIKVDRSSVIGNPFKMKNYSVKERNRVCDEYTKYFDQEVKKAGAFRNEVIRIYRLAKSGKNIALGCWCFPLRCHAMYIKEFIEFYL